MERGELRSVTTQSTEVAKPYTKSHPCSLRRGLLKREHSRDRGTFAIGKDIERFMESEVEVTAKGMKVTGVGIAEKVVVVLSGGGIREMRGEDERSTMGRSVERML